MERTALRVDCLKVAAQLREVTANLRPIQDLAEELFSWVTEPEAEAPKEEAPPGQGPKGPRARP